MRVFYLMFPQNKNLPLILGLALLVASCGNKESGRTPRAGMPTLKAHLHRMLTGQGEPGRQVAFSPDGRLLASSSADGTVRLRQVSDGSLVRTLTHPEGVTSIAFSPDGQSLASGGYDHTVKVWQLQDGALARTLAGHRGTVWSVAFSPDGQSVASGGEDKTVKLWRLIDGALVRTLNGHALNVWCVRFSPDGQLLASGSFDKAIKLWRVDTGALVRTLTGSEEAVVGLAFSPDGQWLASGGDDSSIREWRVQDGRLMNTLTGGSNHVYAVAISPDGQWLASGGRARGGFGTFWNHTFLPRLRGGNGITVRLWRARDGALQQALAEHADDVRSVDFSPDGRWLASSSEDGAVALWSLETVAASSSQHLP